MPSCFHVLLVQLLHRGVEIDCFDCFDCFDFLHFSSLFFTFPSFSPTLQESGKEFWFLSWCLSFPISSCFSFSCAPLYSSWTLWKILTFRQNRWNLKILLWTCSSLDWMFPAASIVIKMILWTNSSIKVWHLFLRPHPHLQSLLSQILSCLLRLVSHPLSLWKLECKGKEWPKLSKIHRGKSQRWQRSEWKRKEMSKTVNFQFLLFFLLERAGSTAPGKGFPHQGKSKIEGKNSRPWKRDNTFEGPAQLQRKSWQIPPKRCQLWSIPSATAQRGRERTESDS